MWHKAEWMGRPMRLELNREGLLAQLANRYTTRGASKEVYFMYVKNLCASISRCERENIFMP